MPRHAEPPAAAEVKLCRCNYTSGSWSVSGPSPHNLSSEANELGGGRGRLGRFGNLVKEEK